MNKKKLLSSILILLISVFTFFGCAKVEFLRTIDGNNVIMDRLVIELDEEKIKLAGQDVNYVAAIIDSDFVTFKSSLDNWKKQFILDDYPDLYKRVQEGIECTNEWTGKKLTITVQFADFTMFGLFYGLSNIEGHEYKKALSDVGPFVSKMLMEDGENENLGFYLKKYSMLKDEGLIANLESLEDKGDDFYRNLYIKYRALLNEQYDVEDLDITQIFVYPDDDVYTNADAEEYYGGLKMFMWNMTGKAEDFEMEIYRLTPRAVNWYVSALVVSAIVVVVLLVNFGHKAREEKLVTKKELEKDGK